MPTLVNAHVHIGYEGYSRWGADLYTPANILDHLQRQAFYGVGATALFIVLPASLTNTLGAWALARPLHDLAESHGVITIPGAIGARIVAEICKDCWGQWLKQQTMLINHYGLNVMDPQARQFLMRFSEFHFVTGCFSH